jgi:hypothetical protein
MVPIRPTEGVFCSDGDIYNVIREATRVSCDQTMFCPTNSILYLCMQASSHNKRTTRGDLPTCMFLLLLTAALRLLSSVILANVFDVTIKFRANI